MIAFTNYYDPIKFLCVNRHRYDYPWEADIMEGWVNGKITSMQLSSHIDEKLALWNKIVFV